MKVNLLKPINSHSVDGYKSSTTGLRYDYASGSVWNWHNSPPISKQQDIQVGKRR